MPDPGSARAGLRLITAIFVFWHDREHPQTIRRWLEQTLQTDRRWNDTDEGGLSMPLTGQTGMLAANPRVAALSALGIVGHNGGDMEQARARAREGVGLARRLGDLLGEAHCLITEGGPWRSAGRYDLATPLLEEALAVARRAGDPHCLWRALQNLGETLNHAGDTDRARLLLEESLAFARSLDDDWGVAMVLRQLGGVMAQQGNPSGAALLIEEGLGLWRQIESRRGLYWTLLDLGRVGLLLDDPQRVAACFAESLMISQDFGDQRGLAKSLEGLAALGAGAERGGDHAWATSAACLLGAALASREANGTPLTAVDTPAVERAVTGARARLGDAVFEMALAEGRALPLGKAVELGAGVRPADPGRCSNSSSLSSQCGDPGARRRTRPGRLVDTPRARGGSPDRPRCLEQADRRVAVDRRPRQPRSTPATSVRSLGSRAAPRSPPGPPSTACSRTNRR